MARRRKLKRYRESGPRLIPISEVLSKYKIGWRRLAEWRKNGLPCLIGPGRSVLVNERDIQIWLRLNPIRHSKGKRRKQFSRVAMAAEDAALYGTE